MDHAAAMSRAEHSPPPQGQHRLRRLLSRALSRLRGPGPRLLDHPGLLAAGHRLLQDGPARRPAALVVFDFEDLPELSELYGTRARRQAVRQVARGLHRIAGSRGFTARTSDTQFTLLIPDCSSQEAVKRAVRELGTPCRFELDLDGGEAVLVPDVLADECPQAAGGLALLHRRLDERLATHRDQRRQREDYLRRSRERYTRPAPLEA